MLQDIFPNKLDNHFEKKEPTDKSLCVAVNNNSILLMEEEHIRFPKYEDLKFEIESYIYLFSLDDEDFFLVELGTDDVLGCEYVSMQEFRKKNEKKYLFAGMTAYHLYVWYRDNRFCGRCGAHMIHGDKERMMKCGKCGNSVYPKIMPAVIVGVLKNDKILVTRYCGRAYRGYALIAGFTEIGETAEETVIREVREETGISVKNIRYYKSQPWGIAQDLLLGYFCEADGDDEIKIDKSELSEAEWIGRDELDIKYEDVSMTNEMLVMFKEGKIQVEK